MKKRKNILVTAVALLAVAGVALICIMVSKTLLNRTAYAQKNEVMAESGPDDEPAVYYEKDETSEKDMSQEAPIIEDSELSKLMTRLERAGVSYDFQNAVQNNEASDEVIAELNALMDDLDATSSGSEEWVKQLKLINEYEIPGITEAVGEEIDKAQAQQIALDAIENMLGIEIDKNADELDIQYKAAGMYAKNDGRAYWDVEDATEDVWYYATIDALTGGVLEADWVSKGKAEGAGEVDVTITQNQLDSYMSAAQSFVTSYLLEDGVQIANCMLGEGAKSGEGYTVIGPTVVIDVVLDNGTVVHNLVSIETTDIIGFYMSMVWEK